MKKFRKIWVSSIVMITLLGIGASRIYGRSEWIPVYQNGTGKNTVSDVINCIGRSARERLDPYFQAANVQYPPQNVTLLAIKDAAKLELWVGSEKQPRFIRTYRIKALSGKSGPKLREGDRQVPEGIYRVEELNPNSNFHLSLKLNYPNEFDIHHAKVDGRTNPGSNIYIHGKAISIGCLAIGDEAIEELFILAADVDCTNLKVIIAPSDPRLQELKVKTNPKWIPELYRKLNKEFKYFVKK